MAKYEARRRRCYVCNRCQGHGPTPCDVTRAIELHYMTDGALLHRQFRRADNGPALLAAPQRTQSTAAGDSLSREVFC